MTAGERRFLSRFPTLFHVADAAAVPLIRRHGLMSAEALCEAFAVPARRRDALLERNRDRYESITHPSLGAAWLRRQYLRDEMLRGQLVPEIAPSEWRRLVNRQVHFWPRSLVAGRLAVYEKRAQVVLVWQTAALLDAGVGLFACRWNNGTTNNRQKSGNRLRTYADYIPVTLFEGGRVGEIVSRETIPAGIPFERVNILRQGGAGAAADAMVACERRIGPAK